MISRFRKFSRSFLIPQVVAVEVALGACCGWGWGYYENMLEVEAAKNSFCGTWIFTPPESGAILGIILGVILGVVSGFLIYLVIGKDSSISILR